jgi:hypothetical protein
MSGIIDVSEDFTNIGGGKEREVRGVGREIEENIEKILNLLEFS